VSQSGRSALLVVPARGFQDEELFITRRALELAGVQVAVASTRTGVLMGMLGGTTQTNMLLNQASVDNFDAIVFIGGVGAIDYINNPTAQNLARQAAAQQKVLAAIGTAPSILANAGALQGIRATAYPTEQQRLVLAGAAFTGNPAEKEGLIITAAGSPAAALFAQGILEGLAEVRR
jgi:protease I